MPTRIGRSARFLARHKGWSAVIAASVGAAVFVGPAPTVATAADGSFSLTTDQIAALSNRLTVGAAVNGTTAQRIAAAGATAPAGKPAGKSPASSPAAVTAPGTPVINQTNNIETASGLCLAGTIAGSQDWYRVDTAGQVSRVGAHGVPVWTRTERSMVSDWGVKPTVWYHPVPPQLNMFAGYNPVSAASQASNNTFAVGDFGGHSGGQDIAVAYGIGWTWSYPFTLPDSQLTKAASFVTVFSGVDGHTLWHKVYPGFVTQLVPAAGGLLVGNESGPLWRLDPSAEQDSSRSNLSLIRFTADGDTAKATTAWTYSRQVPWARWTAVTPTKWGIAAAWTDTPMGLGSPRPADGHVILLDTATGKLKFDTPTPGYPRILVADPAHGAIVAAEETDPTDSVSWQLTAFDPATGARSVLSTQNGSFLTTLTAGDGNPDMPAFYATDVSVNSSGYLAGSTALGLTSAGATAWTTPLPAAYPRDITVPGGAIIPRMDHGQVVITTQDPTQDTDTIPDGPEHTQIMALDSRTGAIRWSHSGVVGTGLVPAQFNDEVLSVAADDTAYAYRLSDGQLRAVQPQLGDAYSGVQADVRGHGAKDLIVGGQSRGVFAIDGHPSADGAARILWTATVQGPVHQVQTVDNGTKVLVAATGGWDLIDVRNGRVITSQDIPGAYTWTATPVTTSSGLEIVVPTHDVTAYSERGSQLWSYRPAGSTVKFSDAAYDGEGHVIAEYGTAASDPAPNYGAVSLDVTTGKPAWTTTADPSVTGADFLGAVYASPDIPLGGGHAVAFAWKAVNTRTLIEIRDARTGAVLATHSSDGDVTHVSFAAAPGAGLIQVHLFEITRLQPDGTTWSDTSTFPTNDSGGVAVTSDGSPVVVTAYSGLQAYPVSDFVPDADWPDYAAKSPALDDSNQMTVDGSQVLGFAQDMRLWDLDWQWNGGGYYTPDYSPHGISVNTISDQTATPSAASPASGSASRSTAPSLGSAAGSSLTGAGADGVALGNPITGIGWGDGQMHSDMIIYQPKGLTATAPNGLAGGAIPGYTPAQIEHNLALTGDGQGQTVAIVDAFDHPNIESDLNTFSNQFGLPATCDSVTSGTPCVDFTVQKMPGLSLPSSDWDGETALDVEWAHAVAPKARIVLVEAVSDINADMYRAVDAAAALHPAAVSMSWGQGGEFSGESFYDGHCQLADSVCAESAGDSGNPAGYGATAPDVLSIGGTTLNLDAAGNTLSESAWYGGGGGLSYFEPRPAFQDGLNPSAFRGAPDVSADANPATGVAIYVTIGTGRPRWLQVGGTSVSAPIWAGILAAADGLRAAAGKAPLASADGSVFKAIYSLGSGLNNITTGTNGGCGAVCTAHAGYNTVTGLGSPAPGVDAALAKK